MATDDHIKQPAKPQRHETTQPKQQAQYEHKDITDNRLVWEVLAGEDEAGT
jgi:hypothetical protein